MKYVLYTASIERAIVGDKKVITWSISAIPFAGYSIKNMDTGQEYINHDGTSATSVNPTFRFVGEPRSLTVQVEISNVSLGHGGYIVSADASTAKVFGGAVLAVQGSVSKNF